MKKTLCAAAAALAVTLCLICCTKKGEAIIEPFITTYKFTAYTIDSFRFKIILNDIVITDSLKSGREFTSNFSFTTEDKARLKVYNASTSELYIDSMIALHTGSYIISIVQLFAGQKPAIPPAPSEISPAVGNCKVRFQYVSPQPRTGLAPVYLPFHDSLKCIIRKTVGGIVSYDTIVLSQFESTAFYESRIGSPFTFEIRRPVDDFLYNIVNSTTYSTASLPAFNTVIFYSSDTLAANRFRFSFKRIY